MAESLIEKPNLVSNDNIESIAIHNDLERERIRKEKKKEKEAAKAAKVAKALLKRQQPNNSHHEKDNEKKKKEIRLKKEFINRTNPGDKKDLSVNPLDVESVYDPPVVESAWYAWWEKMGFFNPDETHAESEERLSIVIPPPNVTGYLHLGHALTNSIQDVIVRYHRMNGKCVVWIPGMDHAGIATQAIVEKHLWKSERQTRQELGREEFVNKVWEWKNKYGQSIGQQLRRLGSSLDWTRERFTMDEMLYGAVVEAFVRLARSGKIYRENRLVNWSCALRTAISDIEVESVELKKRTEMSVVGHDPKKKYAFGVIWKVAYKVYDPLLEEELVVATTRPETMLGDTAIAVHPDDERFRHLIGKRVIHPFIKERKIPIIGDRVLVDMNFGTGAVKITPAHDPNDYACAKRNGLEFVNILNLDGTINSNGGEFEGMLRFEAREAIVSQLEKRGLYRGISDNPMVIGRCSRSGDIIEPLLIPQWWVDCSEMGKSALDAVVSGRMEIVPEMHKVTWKSWLSDCHDWCISRQLWWGHRIPAWLVQLNDKPPADSASPDSWVVAHNEQEALEIANQKWPGQVERLDQDPDVVDTWFSSGLFPFSVFGWPNSSDDLEKFYPTTLLETGHDILFFWVARMVMLGLELTGKLPFKQVLLHAMIRDAHGRKMSKSLGNVIDPIDVIEGITKQGLIDRLYCGNLDPSELDKAKKGIEEDFPNGISECGTDALRFSLCSYTSQGRDINLDIMRVQGYRNFCNKIWNATKLSLMLIGWLSGPNNQPNCGNTLNFKPIESYEPFRPLGLIDQWILSRLNKTISDCRNHIENYNFSNATSALYSFWMYDLCDVYLEAVKPIGFGDHTNVDLLFSMRQTLFICIEEGLRLLHPFMPFLTEELWQQIPRNPVFIDIPSICIAPYPIAIHDREQPQVEQNVELCQKLIHSVRSTRVIYNIAKKHTPSLIINVHSGEYYEIYALYSDLIKTLSYSGSVKVQLQGEIPESCAVSVPNETCELYLQVKGLIDVEKEINRINGKVSNLDKQMVPIIKRLNSSEYQKVPENIKLEEAKKLKAMQEELELLNIAKSNLERIGKT